MTPADILGGLLRMNLAAGAAILGVIALRKLVRLHFGARLAYGLWLLPVLAGAAVLPPARQILVVGSTAPVFAAASRAHQAVLASPPAAAMSLDPFALLLGLWVVGALAAALVMARLQHRFMSQAREGAVGPAVVGVFSPRIVTPLDFAERYSRDEQALVMAHEQAHIARQDSRLNGLCAVVQCLFWFNPLVHLAARLMRIDQELACDEVVVTRLPGARRAYAEVLMKVQLAILPLPLGCYWPSHSEHPLVERVAMLKRKDVGRARRRAGVGALAVLCAGVGLGAWAAQPAQMHIIAPKPVDRVAEPGPRRQTPADAATSPIAVAPGETSPTPDRAVAETDAAASRLAPEPSPSVESVSASDLSLAPMANVEVSKASLIRVSDQTPDAGQGPGHYVQESGLQKSMDCRDSGLPGAWHTLSTPPIAQGHVITNFHYELRGDNRCGAGSQFHPASAQCEVVTDRPDRKTVRFQLLVNGDNCFSYTAFAQDGPHHDAEAHGTITQPGAVTQSRMVLSYDVQ